jgi:flagellar motor switch protein FliG
MVHLGDIDPQEQRRIIDEFFHHQPPRPRDPSAAAAVGAERAWRAAAAANQRSDAEGGPERPFHALREAEADKLAKVLRDERPQTVALVLAHLTPEQSASVLTRFDAAAQTEILRRLVDLEETDPEILREVEQALQRRLSHQVQMQRRRVAGLSAVEGIVRAAQGAIGAEVYQRLAGLELTPVEPPALRRWEFTELLMLDSLSLREVVEAAGGELVLLALVGAPPGWTGRMLGVLPPGEAEALRRQLAAPGPIRLSDVEEARQQIADIAQELADAGRLGAARGSAALAAA